MSPFKTTWHFYQGQALLSVWEREDGKRGAGLDILAGFLSLPPSASLNVEAVSEFCVGGTSEDQLSRFYLGDHCQLFSVFKFCTGIPKYSGCSCL